MCRLTSNSDVRFRWLSSGSSEINGSYYAYTGDKRAIDSSGSLSSGIDLSGYQESSAKIIDNVSTSSSNFNTIQMTLFNPYKGGPNQIRAKVIGEKSTYRNNGEWRSGGFTIEYLSGNGGNTYSGFKLFPGTGYMTDYRYQLYGVKGS
tara:strand:- start:277 stop:720 length:444 start_codon:yes stop_codon:yes gene_type:complete